jgi:hypothetical protein
MATTAQFVAGPAIDIAQIGTGNTFRDGTGTMSLICSGPTFIDGSGIGKRINLGIVMGVSGSTLGGAIRLFVSNDGGTTRRLYLEKTVPITTLTNPFSACFRTEIPELVGLVIPGISGSNATQLYAATHNGETFNIIVESGIL